MYKYFRAISVILVLALVAGPVFASVCATSCAGKKMMAAADVTHMSSMANCHEGSMSKGKTKSAPVEKSCNMGAGCNFSQAVSVDSSSKFTLDNISALSFPHFISSEKSVDLSPPLKPPA